MSFGISFERAMCEFREIGGRFMSNDMDTVVAFVEKGNTVEFATAICAPHDTFNPAVGSAIALERFFDGERVTMRREDCVFLA